MSDSTFPPEHGRRKAPATLRPATYTTLPFQASNTEAKSTAAAAPNKPRRKSRARPITKTCHLLSAIPAELRNAIWELVLLSPADTPIPITKKTYHKPALLRTCREIAHEATPIYYGPQNHFTFRSRNFDARPLKLFCAASRGLWRGNPPVVSLRLQRGCHSWGKLVQWLEWFRGGDVPGYGCQVGCTGHACCAGHGAFQLVERLPGSLDWEEVVLPVLGIHKRTTEKSRRLHWRV